MKSSHWPSLPIRRFGAVVGGGTPTADSAHWDGDIPFVTPPDLRPVVGRIVRDTQRTLTAEGAAAGSSIVPANSVLLSIRAPIGYVARTADAMAFNQGCRAIVPFEGTSASYLTYALVAAGAQLDSIGRGTTFMELSATQMAALELPAPPLDEQRAIADYLDHETATIDTLIGEQQQLVELLRERRAAIRDRHFVGTDGKRQTTVKRALRPLSRPARPGLEIVTAYRDGVVTLRSNRRDDGYTFSDTEHGYQEICEGDLVFHALDGFAGAVGVSDSNGNATPVYHVCQPTADDEVAYVALLLRYLGTSGFLTTQAPNVRQRSVDFRNWSTFGRVPLALPPVAEQSEVVREIGELTEKIDTLIAETERFIELARERRAALIAAAVTGQIDVREAV